MTTREVAGTLFGLGLDGREVAEILKLEVISELSLRVLWANGGLRWVSSVNRILEALAERVEEEV